MTPQAQEGEAVAEARQACAGVAQMRDGVARLAGFEVDTRLEEVQIVQQALGEDGVGLPLGGADGFAEGAQIGGGRHGTGELEGFVQRLHARASGGGLGDVVEEIFDEGVGGGGGVGGGACQGSQMTFHLAEEAAQGEAGFQGALGDRFDGAAGHPPQAPVRLAAVALQEAVENGL